MNITNGSYNGFVNFYAGTGNNPHAAGPCWILYTTNPQGMVNKLMLLSESTYGLPTMLWEPSHANKTIEEVIALGPPEGDPLNLQPQLVDSIDPTTGEVNCTYDVANTILGGDGIILYSLTPQGNMDQIAMCDSMQGGVRLLINVVPQVSEATWTAINTNGIKVDQILI